MEIKKTFIKYIDPQMGSITHGDQEVHGLRFREICRDIENNVIFLVKGEESKIADYLERHKNRAIEIPIENIKVEYDSAYPIKELPCGCCGGTGKIIIPEFDLAAIEALMDE